MSDLFYNELGRFFILVMRYRSGFARRAEGEQGGNAVGYQVFYVAFEHGVIYLSVPTERGDHCRSAAFE